MKRASSCSLVFVTSPNLTTARRLVKLALTERLVACGNLIPEIESHYWWQGQMEKSAEILILFKTRTSHLAALERLILANHPYDTPEIVALPLAGATPRYLDWIKDSTAL